MQSRWPFFFAALLLFVITIMSLHVWAQEQSKAREALLAAAAKTNKQTVESRRSVEPRPVGSRVVSGVTANEVKTTPYTRNGRNPFKLPKAKVNVLGKAPVADPVSAPIESREFESRNFKSRDFESGRYEPTETVNPFAAQKHAPEFSLAPLNAIPSETSAAETAPSFGNPWQHDSDPDLGEEPNSPRNNLEKLAELLPPTEQPLPLSDSQSFSPALTPQDGVSPAADDDLLALNPSDDEPEPESVPERDSVFKFASSKKAVASPLPGSTVKKRRRPPAQPIIEIEIPEWDPDAAWPKPTAIIEQLEEFRKHPATEHWAAETHQLLKLLHWTKSIDDPNARVIFEQLRTKLQELDNICIQISDTPVHSAEYAQGYLAGQLRIFHYDIARRIVFWSQIHDIAVRNNSEVLNPQGEKLGMVQASQFRFVPPNLGSEWSGYLGLDELTQSLNSLNPDPKSQRDAARHTLTRFFSSAIKNEHRQFLDPYFDDQLLSYLRDEAAAPVDLQKMLKMIEYHEANLSGYSVAKMNDIYQSLLWSTDPASQQLATQMDGHYRNANFRVSISDEFLNRLVPQQPETNQPIHETVMGAKVRGNGRINNRLRIRLMPDNGQVNLRLEANGVVRSLTQARRNGFTVDNQGQTRYQAFQNLAIGRYGYHAGAAQAHSQTNSRVLRLRSELDPIPLVGWMARRIAKDKIAESTPATERMTDRRIESSAKQEIETQVHQRMAAVRHYLSANLTDPLIAMEMEQ